MLHVGCRPICCFGSVEFLHDVQGQVDAGCQAASGIDYIAGLHEAVAALEIDLRKFFGKGFPKFVVCSRLLAIKQPGIGQFEGPGTNGHDDATIGSTGAQPLTQMCCALLRPNDYHVGMRRV